MKKYIFITIALFFLSSISASANNHTSNTKTVEKTEKEVVISKEYKNPTKKENTRLNKLTSLKSRLHTVQNLLKNPEKEKKVINTMC